MCDVVTAVGVLHESFVTGFTASVDSPGDSLHLVLFQE